ncbi:MULTISPECIES: M42 family metallopeptidase [Tissierellales]|jgi:endoglucanase|uniref:M42 family peptidase n=1 Tax=Acidilutibacter cellobiosedens TaxID=2507161 RepID=A0A410QCJ9_9FIRM|nr:MULTISPECIES: M42 family metallopeptidase [Tissierellales]MBE6082031.1 M42 family metallopeptidase [Tissierellaceae bacterium]QAT61711.1 M42 family peptidase [Acidilutibacter cellobiosedens]SCL82611.1 putative aminopeptidase YsdC [Sporanaerobacter sp. PP17-6a]
MLLKKLTEASGVSGNEREVRNIILDEIKDYVDEVKVDRLGNIIAYKKGETNSPRLMVTAHMDEVGLMVTGFGESGLIKFTTVGGVDKRILVSKPVLVGEKKIPGVIGAKPIHLQKKEERDKALNLDQLYIDIGADSKEEAQKNVEIGDYVSFQSNYVEFGKSLVKAKALDNRTGCSILVNLLKEKTKMEFYGIFTVMEEVGLIGAGPAAYAIEPERAIILEGTLCYDMPDTDGHLTSTTLGKGPAISLMDRTTVFDRDMRKKIEETAKKYNIPYQYRKISSGGNDSGKIHQAKGGCVTTTISVPCRYIHSPISVMSKNDYDNTFKLVKSVITEMEKGDF